MTGRPSAPVEEVQTGRFVWGAQVPWLPDLLGQANTVTLTGNPLAEAFGRQIAFLRAVATGAPIGSALQLRYSVEPEDPRVRCHLLGAADSAADSALLNRIVTTTLPAEFPLEPVEIANLKPLVNCVDVDALQAGQVVEIRRAIERLDPTVNSDRDDPVLFPWTWSPQAMLSSLGLLRLQPHRTVLAVQLEPARLTSDVAAYLQDEIRWMLTDLRAGEENPISIAILRAYRRWLRLLPQGCFALRFVLASDGELTPGLAESLSTDLTRSFEAGAEGSLATATVVTPTKPADLDACAMVFSELRSVPWRVASDSRLAELQFLFDPLEANTAFRLPVAPRGGLAGIASRRIPALGQGLDSQTVEGAGRLEIGSTTSGVRFSLTLSDLNQHVLVAGLPGFGKTSTVSLILRKVWEEAGVPFLVIDPTKRDYEPLVADLNGAENPPLIFRLSRSVPAFNPLAVPDGVDSSVHAGRVIAAFDGALDLSTGWPLAHILLCRAIYRLYEETAHGASPPSMRSLYATVGGLIRSSSFSEEARGNLEGSLLGRLEYLSMGPAGRALSGGPTDAIPWGIILERPCLIELAEFSAPAERSLVFGLLIAGLVSYREANPISGGLGHVTVLEEAHRVLRATSTRDAGVEVFVDAIAELRGAGEGFIVVDQAPSLLHPGILKLTSTKLAHRVVEVAERVAVGSSMVLEGAQFDDMARLGQRRMMAYAASGSVAVLVDLDDAHLTADDRRSPGDPRTSLALSATSEPLYCIECPVMCEGSEGAALLGAVDLTVAEAFTPDRLLLHLSRLTTTAPETYCLAAACYGAIFGNVPASMLRSLRVLSSVYRRGLAMRESTL